MADTERNIFTLEEPLSRKLFDPADERFLKDNYMVVASEQATLEKGTQVMLLKTDGSGKGLFQILGGNNDGRKFPASEATQKKFKRNFGSG